MEQAQANDSAESKAIELALGDAAKRRISSTKSMTGHLLGAAGELKELFYPKCFTTSIYSANH